MKKLICKILTGLALVCTATGAFAQGAAYDAFGAYRTIVWTVPSVAITTGLSTNQPIDISPFLGIGKIDLTVTTNVAAGNSGGMTNTIEMSKDLTNWVALTNIALATAYVYPVTNNFYGSNLKATNTYNLPGSVVSPSPVATAGYAIPALVSYGFTNGSTVAVGAGGTFTLGFNIDDSYRYLHIITQNLGTNWTEGITLTARPKY